MRPLARLDERLNVDAGGLQTLALVDELRELAEAAVLVRIVCVLQRSAKRSRLHSRIREAIAYALVCVFTAEDGCSFRQSYRGLRHEQCCLAADSVAG